jgi:type IV secretory pathway VirB4 component
LSRNSFIRFFDNNESSIRVQINRHNTVIGAEKELLNKLNTSMSAIKTYLLSGAEIYINGNRITL